ncbi:hypothetical protein [Streptomyces sp. NPDC058620]|uniref:hypothetical protein n=1 Tax=Streptomyces sp. NPDC058620 TaxID=3346560 RepID=UPI00364C4A4A
MSRTGGSDLPGDLGELKVRKRISPDNNARALEAVRRTLDLNAGTDLITGQVLDPLLYVELLPLIEQLSGRTVDFGQVDREQVRTLSAVERHFFAVPKEV